MSFVMGKKIEEKGGFNLDHEMSGDEESIWSRLKDVFESTYEVLHELAEERGIDVADIYASENINKDFWGEDFENRSKGDHCNAQVEASDIIRLCLIYEDMADQCLERIFDLLDVKHRKRKTDAVDEAMEVVNWYLDLIQAKMRRALYGYYYQKSFGKKESEDYNGSAKVALIAIDRSLENWVPVREAWPDFAQDISHMLVVLQQLRQDVMKQFPKAYDFQRPGFEIPFIPPSGNKGKKG